MFASIKRKLKWNTTKSSDNSKNQISLLFTAFIGVIEDVLFWKNIWLSLLFISLFNLIFFVFLHCEINFLQIICNSSVVILSIDAFETWLKHKHRTTCLKSLAHHDLTRLKSLTTKLSHMMKKRWIDYLFLRERNHTKAFLLMQIVFGILFVICKNISGYMLTYTFVMLLSFAVKIVPPIVRFVKKIQQNAESDFELEGLLPDFSDANLELLSIEQEHSQLIDEKQSFDYWKPDLPIAEASDSSDNSSSLVTNLSIEKMHTLEKEIESSDSSEDEYIPQVPYQSEEQLKSTLEIHPVTTWTNTAYNVFQNFGGAVASMIYMTQDNKRRKRVSSVDSSDGFEMIDKNDIM